MMFDKLPRSIADIANLGLSSFLTKQRNRLLNIKAVEKSSITCKYVLVMLRVTSSAPNTFANGFEAKSPIIKNRAESKAAKKAACVKALFADSEHPWDFTIE